ncbi:GNAT family N-acetyltransferase [Amaricoccus sp.]|uniref:GNAT family N-acetyltransferase n=1 Tax=Amaricoccus sp. TaxID=1872485 RepID=UPI001B59E88A|nr:GNAT family N-acetyltransferase [Amaricoccus sp.]MBP7243548.1 GNAT family N-acetyltransferase [Amaricoccus sp.]
MTDAPVLRTARLTLRPHRLDDFAPFAAFFASDASRYVGGPLPEQRVWNGFAGDVGSWNLMGFGCWAVDLTETGAFVGQVGLNKPSYFPEREIGWIVFPEHHRQGYAHEAALAARDFAYRRLGWTTAVSYIDRDNAASIALARKLGAVEDPDAARWDDADVVYRHPGPEDLR